ncbi:hypothetical protein BGZ76_008747 [Entomortierella beljakovae]|nr:hypothetical protein BGZ76_008747 [Entomortierella beljakovae]
MEYSPLSMKTKSQAPSHSVYGYGSTDGVGGNSSRKCHGVGRNLGPIKSVAKNSAFNVEGISGERNPNFCVYNIPAPDVNEEDMRVNGEILQKTQDWADFLDGCRKCRFELECGYRRSDIQANKDANKPSLIRKWYNSCFCQGSRDLDNGDAEGCDAFRWIRKLGFAFFIVGFITCFLLSYYKVYRPLSRLNIQVYQRKELKDSMFRFLWADVIIGLLYPIAPFVRIRFCSNRRMVFQARYRVIDHADKCTQAINYANAERTITPPNKSSIPIDPANIDQNQLGNQRDINDSHGSTIVNDTMEPGRRRVRIADIAWCDRDYKRKSTCSAPGRLEGSLNKYKANVTKPMEHVLHRIGNIWRNTRNMNNSGLRTIASSDEILSGKIGCLTETIKELQREENCQIAFASEIGIEPESISSPPLEIIPKRLRVLRKPVRPVVQATIHSAERQQDIVAPVAVNPNIATVLLDQDSDCNYEGPHYVANDTTEFMPHVENVNVTGNNTIGKRQSSLKAKRVQVTQNVRRCEYLPRGSERAQKRHQGKPKTTVRTFTRSRFVVTHRNNHDSHPDDSSDVCLCLRTRDTDNGEQSTECNLESDLNQGDPEFGFSCSCVEKYPLIIQDTAYDCLGHKVETMTLSECAPLYPEISYVEEVAKENDGDLTATKVSFVDILTSNIEQEQMSGMLDFPTEEIDDGSGNEDNGSSIYSDTSSTRGNRMERYGIPIMAYSLPPYKVSNIERAEEEQMVVGSCPLEREEIILQYFCNT